MTVVEAVLHLLEVEGEHAPRHSPVIVQPMLGERPEPLDAVDVNGAPPALANERLGMLQGVVLAEAFERVIAPELVRVVDRSLARLPADDVKEHLFRDSIHHLGVHPSISLQKPENDAFPCRTSSALPLAPAAEVRVVQLNLSRELPRFFLTLPDDRKPELVIDALHCLVRNTEIERREECRLLAAERGDHENLALQPLQALLAFAVPAFPVPPVCPVCLPMAAERTLPPEQI